MKKTEIPILLGVLIYALIALWQGFEKSFLAIQVAGLVLILVAIGFILKTKNGEKLKTGEMIAVWSCIGLFGIYMVLTITEVL